MATVTLRADGKTISFPSRFWRMPPIVSVSAPIADSATSLSTRAPGTVDATPFGVIAMMLDAMSS